MKTFENELFVIFASEFNLDFLTHFCKNPHPDTPKGIGCNEYSDNLLEIPSTNYDFLLFSRKSLEKYSKHELAKLFFAKGKIYLLIEQRIEDTSIKLQLIQSLVEEHLFPPVVEVTLQQGGWLYEALNEIGEKYQRNWLSNAKYQAIVENIRAKFQFNIELEAKLSILNEVNEASVTDILSIQREKERLEKLYFSSISLDQLSVKEKLTQLHSTLFNQH